MIIGKGVFKGRCVGGLLMGQWPQIMVTTDSNKMIIIRLLCIENENKYIAAAHRICLIS